MPTDWIAPILTVTVTNGVASPALSFCVKYADNDGDGIGDMVDIDDDNDGILDISEACTISPVAGTTFGGSFDYTQGTFNDPVGATIALSTTTNYVSQINGQVEPSGRVYINGFDEVGGQSLFNFTYNSPIKLLVSQSVKIKLNFFDALGTGTLISSYLSTPINITLKTSQGISHRRII